MKKLILFLILPAVALLSFHSTAQQVIATAGGYYEGETFSLSWTLGEPVVKTLSGNGMVLTQGFQQPYNFYLTQLINVPAGWSGISSYVNPVNKDIAGIMSPFENELVILTSASQMYYPAGGINTLVNWDYHTGYQVKANDEFQLSLQGTKLNNRMVELSQGWNLIPVLSSCGGVVQDILSGVPGVKIVTDVAGTGIYWPFYGINTLQNFVPGKAYWMSVAAATSFTYPACTKRSQIITAGEPASLENPWNLISPSSCTHIIAIPEACLSSAGIEPGDVIGVFNPQGFCCGFINIGSTTSNTAIVAFGNDYLSPGTGGFSSDEPFEFRLYRPSSGTTSVLQVETDPVQPDQGWFKSHGVSAIKSIRTDFTPSPVISVFPNPAVDQVNIDCGALENVKLVVTDMFGRWILSRELVPGITTLTLSNLFNPGVYNFTFSGVAGNTIKRVVVR